MGPNRFIIGAVICSVAANLLISFQDSFMVILVLWGLNGYFQAMAWPSGMSMLAKWWPSRHRGFAAGLSNGFAGFGQAICMEIVILSFSLAPAEGWRAAFRYPVILPLLVAGVYWLTVKASPQSVGLPPYQDDDAVNVRSESQIAKALHGRSRLYPYLYLGRQWQFDIWLVVIARSSVGRYGLLNWIPVYFTDVMGLDLQDGIIQNLMLSVAMSLGSLIIPAVSDTYCRHHRLLAVLVCSVMGGLSIIGFMVSETVTGLSIFLCIGGFFLYAINGLVWPFAMDCGGRELSGTAGAIFGFDAYADPEVQDAIKHALDNNGYEEKYLLQSFGTSELGGKLVAEGKNIEADVVTMSMYYIDSAQQKITCLQI
jgi:sugar phosphate permease